MRLGALRLRVPNRCSRRIVERREAAPRGSPKNSDFDLYSMGKDGASVGPLTAKASRDDVVRASDGRFVGLASDFDP